MSKGASHAQNGLYGGATFPRGAAEMLGDESRDGLILTELSDASGPCFARSQEPDWHSRGEEHSPANISLMSSKQQGIRIS